MTAPGTTDAKSNATALDWVIILAGALCLVGVGLWIIQQRGALVPVLAYTTEPAGPVPEPEPAPDTPTEPEPAQPEPAPDTPEAVPAAVKRSRRTTTTDTE